MEIPRDPAPRAPVPVPDAPPHAGADGGLPGQRDYEEAAAAVCRRDDPLPALERAAQRGHPLAAADLAALRRIPAPSRLLAGSRWARQHCEIVTLAGSDPERAEALLREHVIELGCDPLALFVVAGCLDGIDGRRVADLRAAACTC